jgi:hypothetical protein
VKWSKKRNLAEVDPGSAEEFLKAATTLSNETAHRRAQTLEAWHTVLVPHHYSRWVDE